jgi:threonine/homoserine/homoserine lactone efflux protein
LLLQAIGAALPAALAVALSPFPVIGIVLMLAGPHGKRNGPLFAVGWVVGLTVVAVLVVLAFGGADDPDSTSSAIADWSRVLVGAAMVVLGVRKWRSRPRRGEDVEAPKWMASLETATAGKALVLGALSSGANPKNFILAAAATTSMIEAGAHGSDLVIAVSMFVLVGSITVLGAVAVRLVGGQWGIALLDSVRQFMVENTVVITVIIMVILGANVLGNGLAGLGR